MSLSFLKMGGLPEYEGRANRVDCTLISRFSARKGACQFMLKMSILRTDDPSSQHKRERWLGQQDEVLTWRLRAEAAEMHLQKFKGEQGPRTQE